ncbi:MAG: RIP metalloprotease RseP [Bacteroidales bacterium]|jgi:regulator of sigma E protease|nr:RIP metalloprotease RseP [Bacteroidales bacterium]MDD4394683.1 RIP metalloprotease RseP [Bacteroidales bacterium]
MGITTQIIGLILSLSILVFVHELGHYFFARIFKTRVEKFYLFFNPGFSIMRMKKIEGKWKFSFFSTKSPQLFKEHSESTEWGIGWLPLGGYCSIAGMVDETTKAGDLPAEPQPWEFRAKPAWQRLFIIIGGVLVNFVTALILYVAILFTWGDEYIPMQNAKYGLYFSEVAQNEGFKTGDEIVSVDGKTYEKLGDFATSLLVDDVTRVEVLRDNQKDTVYLSGDFAQKVLASGEQAFCQFNFPFIVDSVVNGSVAEKAKLQKNDSLVALNDSTIFSFFEFQSYLQQLKNQPIKLVFCRNNKVDTVQTTLTDEGKLGVYPVSYVDLLGTKHVDYGFWSSIPNGIQKGFQKLGDYVKSFKLIFTKEGASQLGGFGTIGSIFPKEWDWEIFWNMTAFLSLILAFMNFLPIPALDGGYILFILVEMITRRKPSDKFIGYANTIGFILLFALLIYANGMDILRAFK